MKTDLLGDRMKKFENASRYSLIHRTPIILRIDGRAFHTYTKKFERPYDYIIHEAMVNASRKLMKEIDGCEMLYVQSDEASFFIKTYNKFNSEMWFGGSVQKICSVSSSIFTSEFNEKMYKETNKKATFDSRCFNLSKEEVYNYFVWRGNDCTRNAIGSYATFIHGHKKTLGIGTGDRLNLIPKEIWAGVPEWFKFGSFGVSTSDDLLNKPVKCLKDIVEPIINKQEDS